MRRRTSSITEDQAAVGEESHPQAAPVLPGKPYTLLKTKAQLTPEHKKNIAKSFHNMGKMEIPFQYLRKNSPDRQLEHRNFNKAALTFIALVDACAESDPDDRASYSLADLVEIIQYCWEECKESRNQIIACLAYTLPIQQYISVFLALAPSKEKFDPKVGWSRSTGLYDSFFPQLAEAVSVNYLNAFSKSVCELTLAYVRAKALNEIQIQKIHAELTAKTIKDPSELLQESKDFVKELIDPIIQFLLDTKDSIPPEVKSFLYESGCYLSHFNRNDVDVLTQLFGLFFTKFIHPAILQSEYSKMLQGVPERALTILAINIQRLTTQTKDERLYGLIKAISVETPLPRAYLPFEDSDGTSKVMGLRPETDILEAAMSLLIDPKHAEAEAKASKNTPSAQSQDKALSSTVPLKTKDFDDSESSSQFTARRPLEDASSSDDGGAEGLRLRKKPHEQSPLVRKKLKPTSRECNRFDAGKYTLASLLFILGAFFSNSIILEDIGAPPNNVWSRHLGPVWSSVVGAIPGLIFLALIITLHCRRDKSANSKTTHRDNTSGNGVSTFHRKVADGSTTEDDPTTHSFASAEDADAEEGETPRPGTNQ